MTEDRKPVAPTIEQAERGAWEQPEVRRMEAGQAEVAFTTSNDGGTQS